ncbi:hypothetical protein Tco_0076216, partial [Tanacetum coccineum]
DDQLKDEFDKIRHALDNLQAQNLRRSLKRPGADVEQPGSKKSKSSAAPQTPVLAVSHQSSAGVTNVHQSPFVDTPPATPPHLPKASSYPDATTDTFVDPPVPRSSGPRTRSHSSAAGIKTYSTRRKSLATRKMSSSEVDLTAPDNSFIQVLLTDDSDDNDPLFFWHAFAAWEVVPTGLGSADIPYHLSVSLMKKMLKHKLEVEVDGVGNDMTYAVQLITFIKNQLASSVPST